MLLVHASQIIHDAAASAKIGTADLSRGLWLDDNGDPIGPIPSLSELQRPRDGARHLLTAGLVPLRTQDGATLIDAPEAETAWQRLAADHDEAISTHARKRRTIAQLAEVGADGLADDLGDPPTAPVRYLGPKGLQETPPKPKPEPRDPEPVTESWADEMSDRATVAVWRAAAEAHGIDTAEAPKRKADLIAWIRERA